MTGWRATAALSRALVVGGVGIGFAVLAGEPVLVVLTAPLILCAALGLAHRPVGTPRLATRLDHYSLHEGQGTTSRLVLQDADDVEHVTRVAAGAPYVAMHPSNGRLGRMTRFGAADVEVSPRRWGRRVLGEELIGLCTAWAGYRWGPVPMVGHEMRVLPSTAPFDSRAEAPQPAGLVGAHRSRREGTGTEFAGIRPFQPGDRLRRINWRVSVRTDRLHVTTSRAEQDTGVLLVVDALADHGRSEGVDGAASSLDLTMRAAAAIAEHHLRRGDRVALRVIGREGEQLGYGAGHRRLRVLLGTLAGVRPNELWDGELNRLRFRASAGTEVIVLSPMLSEAVATATATLVRRGLPTLVVDTLPADAAPGVAEGADPKLAELAWRMRKVEREQVLARLGALGCPVVPWRGPGTLDDVLHRLSRRAQLPQVRVR
ncbi:DUF58 domain-containing protein [Nocardioides sp.]|uniref:DUF58 domain-containing protein n=1 Tax=Nocardioides sp. TaxID=35761 RepID=UPI0031FE9ABA|nr:hypothetical protein [Nocardioides sp.]